MNDSMTTAAPGGPATAEMFDDSDYRMRELEARLDRRITAVEAQRDRMRWTARALGAGLVLTLGGLAMVFGTVVPGDDTFSVSTLSAEEVVLRDADGIARGRLATGAEGQAELALTDRDGRERIRLTVLADGSPGVTIMDRDDRPRAVLGHLPDGTTNLVFADARGVSRAVFGLEADGSTQALFTDADGALRTVVGVSVDGTPAVEVFESGGGGS